MTEHHGTNSRVDLHTAMSILADNFIEHAKRDAILTSVTCLAVELITAVDFADVLLIDRQSFQSLAPTSERAIEVDALQIDTKQGPCLTAATAEGIVCTTDLATETRWPRFGPAAVKAGVHAMMSFKLYRDPPGTNRHRNRGALNMFSTRPHDFTTEERTIGALLATHATSALITADRQTQLQAAIQSRDVIGQAKGVLMERFSINAAGAFTLLKQLSQQMNTPVRDLAYSVINTRR